MEPHPIPQNVTAFEFHLVGDMTLKQFIYLATGVITAYLTFIFLLPQSSLLALPIILLSSISGAAFAFLPLGDRPLDHWMIAFFKAVFSPTQRVWQPLYSSPTPISPQSPLFKNRLTVFLTSLEPTATPPLSPPLTPKPLISVPSGAERPILSTISPQPLPPSYPFAHPPKKELAPASPTKSDATPSPLPSDENLKKLVDLARQAQLVQTKITDIQGQLNQIKLTPPPTSSGHQFERLVDKFHSLIEQSQAISDQLTEVRPLPQPEGQPLSKPVVKIVDKSSLIKSAPSKPPITIFPNIINGVVTGASGNLLEGVVVIIHNKDGLPVRALKTNKLGQFTGATPLPDGTYTITLEKDGLDFDVLQVQLDSTTLPPLSIAAKSDQVVNLSN